MATKQYVCYYIVITLEILTFFGVISNSRLISKHEVLPPHEHALKTIKTQYGDIYDCVDFYKQPSLSHPSLKNHSFYPEMMPTYVPKGKEEASQNETVSSFLEAIKLKDGGCPKGTVPIRRTLKDGVLPPISSLPHIHDSNSSNYIRPGTFYAIAETKNDVRRSYYGAGAYISIYKTRIYEPVEYSSAELIIKSGSDSIIVGWTVNPSVYHDNQTRLFVYTLMDDKPCFNAQCGFVSTRRDLPPDVVITQFSTRGGQPFVIRVLIYKEVHTGNWWLKVHDEIIGFWPASALKSLSEYGTYVACGGEVYFPNRASWAVPPDMGCGYKPTKKGHIQDNAFCQFFSKINEDNQLVDVDGTVEYVNDPDNYRVWDQGYTGQQLGHVVLFGGPFK
ncbi:hypothetical protein RND81_08G147900 [Saponaria officinalis]|uniref:Neprosin PEP catalytic domain-containing protein n=1 Tax=Saponaria officinalis TaxID=3572 RepID=A0AAW1J6U8_SAPOF